MIQAGRMEFRITRDDYETAALVRHQGRGNWLSNRGPLYIPTQHCPVAQALRRLIPDEEGIKVCAEGEYVSLFTADGTEWRGDADDRLKNVVGDWDDSPPGEWWAMEEADVAVEWVLRPGVPWVPLVKAEEEGE